MLFEYIKYLNWLRILEMYNTNDGWEEIIVIAQGIMVEVN